MTVVPGDVPYALFFTTTGPRDATGFTARDGVPLWTDFVPDGFSTGRGIRLILGPATDLTNAADADAGAFDPAATSKPDDPGPVVNGLVCVDIGTLAYGVFQLDPLQSARPAVPDGDFEEVAISPLLSAPLTRSSGRERRSISLSVGCKMALPGRERVIGEIISRSRPVVIFVSALLTNLA